MATIIKYSYSEEEHNISISVNDKFVTTLFNVKLTEMVDSLVLKHRIVTYIDESTISYIMIDDIVTSK